MANHGKVASHYHHPSDCATVTQVGQILIDGEAGIIICAAPGTISGVQVR